MKNFIIKLIDLKSAIHVNRQRYDISISDITCGDGWKRGRKFFLFCTKEKDLELVLEVMRRFKMIKFSNIQPNSFEFYHLTNEKVLTYFFRIARYVRSQSHINILKKTLEINDSGVNIANSFAMAHSYCLIKGELRAYDISYGRDPFTKYYHYKLYKNINSFKRTLRNNKLAYTNLFLMAQQTDELTRLLMSNSFKEVESILIK
jgi:hypothetical protein